MEKDNELESYVDFEKIRSSLRLSDPYLFSIYLKEVYKDLIERKESDKVLGISKVTFFDYIKIQVFIAEKLFNTFDKNKDSYLNLQEFSEGLYDLFMGDFIESLKVIFELLDFDKDGKIESGDAKLMLSYLPLKNEDDLTINHNFMYKNQMKSLSDIDEIIELSFKNQKQLTFKEFENVVENECSDVFLQILCYFYQNRPFNNQNIQTLKKYGKSRTYSEENCNLSNFMTPEIKRIKSPSKTIMLSPADSFFKLNSFGPNLEENWSVKPERKESLYYDLVRMPNKLEINQEKIQGFDASTMDINNIIEQSKTVFDSPSLFLKKRSSATTINEFNLQGSLFKIDEFNLNDPPNNINQESSFEGHVMKLTQNKNLKSYYLVLVNKDIVYYRNEDKEDFLGMHNLSGCFLKEVEETIINHNILYSFTLVFSSKSRVYYTKTKSESQKWVDSIRLTIGHNNFLDHYEIINTIGEGKFGLVKLGIHRKTKEKVAIKIIKKAKMTNSDLELIKTEIDILKLSRHPNIVRLLDHYENDSYLFLIMELLTGGDLDTYLKKNCYSFTEKHAANIIKQIASGLKYLHTYGIIHRDLKPENIMLENQNLNSKVKIMDFGLSKILGPSEKTVDGFGTLSFVAPEVLTRKPYNKQVDIWSLGITLYYMLTGKLPFDDANDNEEIIAKKTVFQDVKFPSSIWKNRSQEVINLIKNCLVKRPDDRITIDQFLLDEWVISMCSKI